MMELEDLKKSWKVSGENIKTSNVNTVELIQNKTYGPVASLKRRFRKQLIVLPAIATVAYLNLSNHHRLFANPIFWSFIVFFLLMLAYFFYNYQLVSKIETTDEVVKASLQKQVKALTTSFRWRKAIVRAMFVYLVLLVEVLMYFKQEPGLGKWYAQPVSVRVIVYAISLILLYFLTRFTLRYKYERHLKHLESLVKQMQ